MIEISVSPDKVCVIDDEFKELVKLTWYLDSKGYVYRNKSGGGKLYIHREIFEKFNNLKLEKEHQIDHENKDKLDNTICNLRLSNNSWNHHNILKRKDTSSKYFGVKKAKKDGKWRASISKDKKEFYIGVFESEYLAARMFDAAAFDLYGSDYCNTNVKLGILEPTNELFNWKKQKQTLISNTNEKHIYLRKDNLYHVRMRLHGKELYCGSRSTLEEAKILRDFKMKQGE